jgi:hypothetical protein
MFRVRWERRALDELADFWTRSNSPGRRAITAAAHAVENRLQAAPQAEGESRPRGRRITFEAPLAVTFRIEADGRTVSILQLRLYGKRKP